MKKIIFSVIALFIVFLVLNWWNGRLVNRIDTRLLINSEHSVHSFDYNPHEKKIYFSTEEEDKIGVYLFDIETNITTKLVHPEERAADYFKGYVSFLKDGQVMVAGADNLLFFKDNIFVKSIPVTGIELQDVWDDSFRSNPKKSQENSDKCSEHLYAFEEDVLQKENVRVLGFAENTSLSRDLWYTEESLVRLGLPRFILFTKGDEESAFDLLDFQKCSLSVPQSFKKFAESENLSLTNTDAVFNRNEDILFSIENNEFVLRHPPYGYVYHEYDCEGDTERIEWDGLIWQTITACTPHAIVCGFSTSGHVLAGQDAFIYNHCSIRTAPGLQNRIVLSKKKR